MEDFRNSWQGKQEHSVFYTLNLEDADNRQVRSASFMTCHTHLFSRRSREEEQEEEELGQEEEQEEEELGQEEEQEGEQKEGRNLIDELKNFSALALLPGTTL